MRFIIPLALGLATLGAPAARALDLSGSFEAERERHSGVPAHGFSAGLSQPLGAGVSLGVSYSQLRTRPFTAGGFTGREQYESGTAALGAAYALTERFGVSGNAGYAQSEIHGLDDFANDPVARTRGPSGSLAFTYWPHPWVQLYAGPAYSYIGRQPAWQGSVGASFLLLNGVWFTASGWGAAASAGWSAGLGFAGI